MSDKMTSSCLGIIPVRLQSTRLPGKPLRDIAGQTLVERVWRQASKAERLSKVVIATDSDEIEQTCRGFGACVIRTGSYHVTGSDRVAEAFEIVSKKGESFELAA